MSLPNLAGTASILAIGASIVCLPCINRSNVKIGVVHHGVPTDVYWQGMDIAINQGAKDMGSDLRFDPLVNKGLDQQEEIFQAMTSKIEEYCGEEDPVNAILVSLPSNSILTALDTCRAKNIAINTFNAGPDLAKSAGLLFFGQNETMAGYQAGEALAEVETTETFCCANHAVGVDVLVERCGGFLKGVEASGKNINFADVSVDVTDCDAWKSSILESCTPNEGKSWDTIGVYWAGQANHKCGAEFLREYNASYAVASDVSEDMYNAMSDGLNILFGIDQQSYLQGYLPFSHLTLAVTNDQVVENHIIETGPHRVTEPPTEHFEECANNDFQVCDKEEDIDIDESEADPTIGESEVDPTTSTETTPTGATPTEQSPEEEPSPAEPAPTPPASRSLSQSTDYTHHISLTFGGIILAVGGYILAN